MIRYSLKCDRDHSFDSWFASAQAYDRLRGDDRVACVVCGSTTVEKALMAPAVRGSDPHDVPQGRPLSAPAPEGEAIAALRRAVEENSDYVGLRFAEEARAMQSGEAPERTIHGEANLTDVRALIDEGIAVTPLPFMSPRKTN